ncbi:isoprenylcysteine alpha-carbonyl methylesterase ICME-like isoform X2 [Momordica charantia]|uniref:protein-S-isoprenylcysteine alpha-carbonyl methylesterase n=1 Tax=Momordica charantia TaxID=3673 RepID=A0A6J1D4N4_MOMCH|nr:isoprenylcysteine alpha-carbonyl methylesterase ICME-like isoform X2 [Momordica charantia]
MMNRELEFLFLRRSRMIRRCLISPFFPGLQAMPPHQPVHPPQAICTSRSGGESGAKTFCPFSPATSATRQLNVMSRMPALREPRDLYSPASVSNSRNILAFRWIARFIALGCYSLFLLPGFLQVGYYYFSSSQIRRSIPYGDKPRNKLDLYLPKHIDGPKPVVAFITGGAWIIGYKAWGCLLGQQLSERDVIVACIDYRNFPQGTMSDMINDASQGISFLCNNIREFGGDPNRIYLMGQSAGAHIAACTLLGQAMKEVRRVESISWSVSQIKAFFGLSGGYNLLNLVDYFHSRGLSRSLFLSIMEGEQSLKRFSPEVMISEEPNIGAAVSILPPVVLFHGTADYSIPSNASKTFAETLKSVGVKAETFFYEGKTHTDVFVQDPMRGGKDQMFEDLVSIIHANDAEALAKDAVLPPRRRLVPEFMLTLARRVSPF